MRRPLGVDPTGGDKEDELLFLDYTKRKHKEKGTSVVEFLINSVIFANL